MARVTVIGAGPAGLMAAESHGEYFTRNIRDVFAFEHLD